MINNNKNNNDKIIMQAAQTQCVDLMTLDNIATTVDSYLQRQGNFFLPV